MTRLKHSISICIFLTLCIAALLCLNSLYEREILPQTIDYQHHERLKDLSSGNLAQHFPDRTIRYAFFGDSHTAYGVNPAYIPRAYNFAGLGRHLRSAAVRLDQLLNDPQLQFTIEYLVLEFDLRTYSTPPEVGARKISVADAPATQFAHVPLLERLKLRIETQFPVVGNGKHFQFLLYPQESKVSAFGWIPLNNIIAETEVQDIEAAYGYLTRLNDTVDNESINQLRRILELANSHSISVVFVKYPKADIFYDFMYEKFPLDEYYGTLFDVINATLEQDYYVLDYHNLFKDHQFFSDPSHVNTAGAIALSKHLHNDLLTLHRRHSFKSHINRVKNPLGHTASSQKLNDTL